MFLQNLKQQTAASHKALEHNSLSVSLMKETVSICDYTAYLKKLYGFVYVFEKNIFPLLQPMLPDLDQRKKTHLLEADLTFQRQDFKTVPLPDTRVIRSSYSNPAAALGGMYVLEGSTLGGQMIQRHVQKYLGESVGLSLYFGAYEKHTGSYWKSFLQHICAAAENLRKEEEIIAAAVQTFSLINLWMTKGTLIKAQNEHQEFSK